MAIEAQDTMKLHDQSVHCASACHPVKHKEQRYNRCVNCSYACVGAMLKTSQAGFARQPGFKLILGLT
jgi:hypothetical protein